MREYVVENEFVKAVRAAGGVAYKLTSQTANGLSDRLESVNINIYKSA